MAFQTEILTARLKKWTMAMPPMEVCTRVPVNFVRCIDVSSGLLNKAGRSCTILSSGLLDSYAVHSRGFVLTDLLVLQYVHYNLPTQIWDPMDLWRDYPHIPLPGLVKFYYLSQTAFYTHQILILNAEARRKDHVRMMTHHVITVILMAMSYFSNFTRVGCLIMILMDWCDIFLPVRATVPRWNSTTHCYLVG
jgi:TLC domain